MSEKQSIQVTIFHQTYTLRAAGNDQEVQELADTVDQLMTEIASKASNADPLRVAVLACLHLADRLRTIERDLNDLKKRVDVKTARFRGMLDQALGSGTK